MRGKATLMHGQCECILVQSLWDTIWRFLKKIRLDLSYDPVIPFLSIRPKETSYYLEELSVLRCPLQHCSQQPRYEDNLSVHQCMNRWSTEYSILLYLPCVYPGRDLQSSTSRILFRYVFWIDYFPVMKEAMLRFVTAQRNLGCRIRGSQAEKDTWGMYPFYVESKDQIKVRATEQGSGCRGCEGRRTRARLAK